MNNNNYAILSRYNVFERGMNPPLPVIRKGEYILPTYLPQSYNALNHGLPYNNSGYFTVKGAYGENAYDTVTKYVSRLCNDKL